MPDELQDYRRVGGALWNHSPWIKWVPGDRVVVLDGDFSAALLREIADHMDRVSHTVSI